MTTNNLNESQCSLQDERYANLAMLEADKSTMKHHKHGCIAVVSGTIVARGCNTYRSHSNDGFLTGSCSCHAEIDVLRKLSRINQRGSNHHCSLGVVVSRAFYGRINIYVVRKDRGGNTFKDSSPCLHCSEVMKSLNIKNIIYSNSSGTLTKCRVKDYTTSHISQGDRFLKTQKKPQKNPQNKINYI